MPSDAGALPCELLRQAVHFGRALLDLALRIDEALEIAFGDAPAQDLDATDLDHPVARLGEQACGLGVKRDLPRGHLGPLQLVQPEVAIVVDAQC